MLRSISRFISDESGATALEYGLLAALDSIATIVALTALGGSVDTMFLTVADTLSCAGGPTTSSGGACP
jgi:pilus assembly protein Flp/PilA